MFTVNVILSILLSAGLFFLIVLLMRKQFRKKQALAASILHKPTPSSHVDDFSGDNRYDTELDLAQAYIELSQYEKAKHLLKSVIDHGAPHQILAARKMFSLLLKHERDR